MQSIPIIHDTLYTFLKSGLSISDTIHYLLLKQLASQANSFFLTPYIPSLLSGLLVGIVAAVVSLSNSKRSIRADIYLKSKNDWKNDIMRYFSELAAELKLEKAHRNRKLIDQNISLLRLLLNPKSYQTHNELYSKLEEITVFLNGNATHIESETELDSLISSSREAVYAVCKEAWDDIQKTLHIPKKRKKKRAQE